MSWNVSLLLVFAILAQHVPAFALKVLCLHGGGQTAAAFQNADGGMQALQTSFPNVEFVFAQSPYPGSLWLRDPTGGKGQPTTDPNWAAESLAELDRVVETQGPFAGILGYSQGAAFVAVYLAHAPQGTFSFAAMFCGYLTTTHQGVLSNVNAASPFGNVPALAWMGGNDFIISNTMSQEQAAKFTSPTVVTSPNAGHAVPSSSDPTYSQVVSFMQTYTSGTPTPTPTPAPTATTTKANVAPTPTPTTPTTSVAQATTQPPATSGSHSATCALITVAVWVAGRVN